MSQTDEFRHLKKKKRLIWGSVKKLASHLEMYMPCWGWGEQVIIPGGFFLFIFFYFL